MKEQPECIVDECGHKKWYFHGKLHREDGPAVEYSSGAKHWLLHGKRHRKDGPAYEGADGYKQWWLHDERVHPETLVDLQLSRGVFCYYNEQSNELRFE